MGPTFKGKEETGKEGGKGKSLRGTGGKGEMERKERGTGREIGGETGST